MWKVEVQQTVAKFGAKVGFQMMCIRQLIIKELVQFILQVLIFGRQLVLNIHAEPIPVAVVSL